jgi:calcium-dependent protein kinase
VKKARDIFLTLDVNNDGKLSREELINGFRKLYGEFAEEEVDSIMRVADSDGSGEIDYSEWLAATTDKNMLISDEKLRTAFEYFDKDGSGSISLDEIKSVLGVKKRLVDDKIWSELIREADADGNGEIDYDEFKGMMSKLVKGGNLEKQFTFG